MSGVAVPVEHLVLGGTIVDSIWFYKENPPASGSCGQGFKKETIGGVGLNVARHLRDYGNNVAITCVVGDDAIGTDVIRYVRSYGIRGIPVINTQACTGSFVGLHAPEGNVVHAIVDKEVYKSLSTILLAKHATHLRRYKTWTLDSSFSRETFKYLNSMALNRDVYVVICGPDEVDNIVPILGKTNGLFCNVEELLALASHLQECEITDIKLALYVVVQAGVQRVFATDGANGVHVWQANYIHFPALPAAVVCVNGAGDAFAARVIHELSKGTALQTACQFGLQAAKTQIEATIDKPVAKEENYVKVLCNA